MTTAKIDELRQRLAAILRDLTTEGAQDGEAMFMLGSIATRIADQAKVKSWSAVKPRLIKSDYARLLRQIADEGNQLVAHGKTKQAYALQAIAISLVAAQEQDPVLLEGERLIDAFIDQTVVNFRKHAQPVLRKPN